jgi:hypothetical protein
VRRWLPRKGFAPPPALHPSSGTTKISSLALDSQDALPYALMTAAMESPFRPLEVISEAPRRVYEDPHAPVGDPPASRAALVRLPQPAQDMWNAALAEELHALNLNKVFGPQVEYHDRQEDVPVIQTNTIFSKKAPDHEGRVRLKARIVALGNQEPIDPEERTASPTIVPALVKIMAAVGLTRQLAERASHTAQEDRTTLTSFDVGTAFLNGDMKEKRAYVRYVDSAGRSRVSSLDKPLYGLRVASLRWHEKFTADVAAFGLRPFRLNPCVFTNEDHTIPSACTSMTGSLSPRLRTATSSWHI